MSKQDESFIGNLCRGENTPHGEACVEEIHLRGWAVHCECECHKTSDREAEMFPHGCADRDTFQTIFGGGHSDFLGFY